MVLCRYIALQCRYAESVESLAVPVGSLSALHSCVVDSSSLPDSAGLDLYTAWDTRAAGMDEAARKPARTAADTIEAAHILAWDMQDMLADHVRTVVALVAAAVAIPSVGTGLEVELDLCSQAEADSA